MAEQRKQRSAQQKLEIVVAGMRGDRSVRDVCREHDVSEAWNVIPDDERPAVSPDLRAALNAHFAIDAAKLKEMGVQVPWSGGTGVDG